MLEALTSYEQADHDGVFVKVSRQAVDEAVALIRSRYTPYSETAPPNDVQAHLGNILDHWERVPNDIRSDPGMDNLNAAVRAAAAALEASTPLSATCPECATARAAANSWKDELTALRQRFSDACSEITRLSGQESATPARSTYPWGAQFKVPVATEAQKLADKIEAIQDDGGEGVPWSQDELDLMVSALRSTAPLIAALDKIQAMEWPAGDAWAGARKASAMWEIADKATRDYYARSDRGADHG